MASVTIKLGTHTELLSSLSGTLTGASLSWVQCWQGWLLKRALRASPKGARAAMVTPLLVTRALFTLGHSLCPNFSPRGGLRAPKSNRLQRGNIPFVSECTSHQLVGTKPNSSTFYIIKSNFHGLFHRKCSMVTASLWFCV